MAAAIVSIGTSNEKGAKAVVWILAVFLACRAVYLFLVWLVQFWAITNARLLTVSGLFARAVTSYDLKDLRYCDFERTFGGRLLGYGTIVFNAGKLNRTLIDYLPYPEQIYLRIYGIVSPELAYGSSDEDDNDAGYELRPPDVDQPDPG
ncbi:MAG TPA: PH domain-containing protein [Streptosporangiaceae bacterium]|nr:PH domain-containing protein [Streptosporangiaceae bacterium]